jgi:hypothetical protein
MAKRMEQRLKHRAVSGEVVSANQSKLDLIGEAGLRTTEVGTARWRGMPPIVHPIIYGKAETI